MRILPIVILMIINVAANSQNTNKNDFMYQDSYGDTIIINDKGLLIDQIDTVFLKKNFSGLGIINDLLLNNDRYKIVITAIKRIKRNKKYEISVIIIKQNPNIEDILKSMGISNYLMVIKKENTDYKIDSITYLSGEI